MTFGRRQQTSAIPTSRSSEIVGARWKAALYLIASLAFAVGGALMLNDPDESRAAAMLCLMVFGIGAVVFLVLLLRPQRLVLNSEGFEVSGGLVGTPKLVRWRDIEPLFVYRLPRAGKMIGYNFRPGVKPESTMGRIARRFGADAALPKGWPMSPDAMVEHLNAVRAQALGERAPARF
jgi:hypothetical protein